MEDVIKLLATPVYGMSQVDRLLGLPGGTAMRWIDGYSRGGRRYDPIVRLAPTGDDIVTWGELSEARFLAEFRNAGVPIIRLRPAVDRLRERFNVLYPLAYARPFIDPLGREVVQRVQVEVGLERQLQLVVVRDNQLVLSLPAADYVEAVHFNDAGVVEWIQPEKELDQVRMHPQRQFGVPAVRSVPTAVIAEMYRAGDGIDLIASLYNLTADQVEQALRYELGGGRPSRAA